jgi:hypothetical protein
LLVTGLAEAFEQKLMAVYANSENRSGIGRAERLRSAIMYSYP